MFNDRNQVGKKDRFMKKFMNLFLGAMLTLMMVIAPKAYADEISDVKADYWASPEITEMVKDGVMTLDAEGNFAPEASVKRADFTTMLVKVLGQGKLDVYIDNPFSDVNNETRYKDDIMRSEQIGLVYGYPDGTFKPEQDMIRAEVTSTMSHITKDAEYDMSVLNQFADADLIPDWAKPSYAKTVKYNLYVNHPEVNAFEPTRNITRAETAVLLAKLKKAISNVKEEYKADNTEKTLSVEHLSINSKADSNIVTITNLRKIVAEGNILKVSFDETFKSKKAEIGDTVVFTNNKDIITDEGTLVAPKGSKFYATIENFVKPRKMNKAAAVKFNFNKLELPNGTTSDMDATVYNKLEGYLKDKSAGKLLGYTLGGAAVGTGVASGVGFPTDEVGTAYAIGIPVGTVGGFVCGLLTKGVNYKAHKGEEVYIKLNQPLSIQESL